MANIGDVKSDELKDYYYTPAGVIYPYAGATLPDGWIWCNGASYGTATYSSLFTALGYSYGGAGANFNVPDLRGRVGAGKDNMGGSSANRLTSAGAGIAGTVLNASGGTESVTLAAAQSGLPAHNVNPDGGHTHTVGNQSANHSHSITVNNNQFVTKVYGLNVNPGIVGGFWNDYAGPDGARGDHGHTASAGIEDTAHTHSVNGGSHQHTVTAANAASSHSNTQPTIIINYIIKT
jgi:microcystin-dependent protein